MFGTIEANDESSIEKYRQFVTPMLDSHIRQSIQMLWFALPPTRRNVSEVEKEFKRIADRAFADLREDISAFGLPGPASALE
jgi:hypothetical protein